MKQAVVSQHESPYHSMRQVKMKCPNDEGNWVGVGGTQGLAMSRIGGHGFTFETSTDAACYIHVEVSLQTIRVRKIESVNFSKLCCLFGRRHPFSQQNVERSWLLTAPRLNT